MRGLPARIWALVFTAALFAFALGACLDDPSEYPAHDNPWDPVNPNPPRTPSQFRARALSETSVLLTWVDQSGNETGFNIFEKFSGEASEHLTAQTAADVDSLVLFDRPPNLERIEYIIEAFNDSGYAVIRPNAFASTRAAPPLPPSEFRAQAVNDTLLRLDWVDRSVVEDRFEVEASLIEPTHFLRVAEPPADSVGCLIVRSTPGARIYLRMRAVNRYGTSPYTETISVAGGRECRTTQASACSPISGATG